MILTAARARAAAIGLVPNCRPPHPRTLAKVFCVALALSPGEIVERDRETPLWHVSLQRDKPPSLPNIDNTPARGIKAGLAISWNLGWCNNCYNLIQTDQENNAFLLNCSLQGRSSVGAKKYKLILIAFQ